MAARETLQVLLALALSASMAAAGSSDQSSKGYRPTDVHDGGTIVGTVTFDGAPVKPELLDATTKEDVCHRDPIYSEKLVVNDEKRVRWTVISIKNIAEGKPLPSYRPNDENRPTLDQKGCVFTPHVAIVPRGGPLRILNSDGILHNVHTWPKKNRSKNMAMPGVIKEMKLSFRRPERVRVTCDIHSWMEAYVVVVEHPYYAVSDEKGEFKLTDVPPGTYTLHLWHETLGELERQVTVNPNSEARVDFTLRRGT